MSGSQAAQGKPTRAPGATGSSSIGGMQPSNRRRCRAAGSPAVLRHHSSPTPWLGGEREGRLLSYSCPPSFCDIQIFFFLWFLQYKLLSIQGSGKSLGTQKGYALRQRLCSLLSSPLRYIPFFPNSRPSPAASHKAEPCRIASHEHRLGMHPHGQASQPDAGHASRRALSLSQGRKVEQGSQTLTGN